MVQNLIRTCAYIYIYTRFFISIHPVPLGDISQPPPQPPSSPIPDRNVLERENVHPIHRVDDCPSCIIKATFASGTPISPTFACCSQVPAGESQRWKRQCMPKANLWLAGGRNLFFEEMRRRPRSGHVAGWKEGLPQKVSQRPQSAAYKSSRCVTHRCFFHNIVIIRHLLVFACIKGISLMPTIHTHVLSHICCLSNFLYVCYCVKKIASGSQCFVLCRLLLPS